MCLRACGFESHLPHQPPFRYFRGFGDSCLTSAAEGFGLSFVINGNYTLFLSLILIGLAMVLVVIGLPNEEWVKVGAIVAGSIIGIIGLIFGLPKAIWTMVEIKDKWERRNLERSPYNMCFEMGDDCLKSREISLGEQELLIRVKALRQITIGSFRISPQRKNWLSQHRNETSGKLWIQFVTDQSRRLLGILEHPEDDDRCGLWAAFRPPRTLRAGDNLMLLLSVNAKRKWKGEIGFRSLSETEEGWRDVHAKIKLKA